MDGFEIFDFKNVVTLKPGSKRSLKVIRTDTDRSGTYDFLHITTMSLSRSVSEINGDFR